MPTVKSSRKTYVEFFSPGILFNESDAVPVESRSIAKFKVPGHAFAFRFFDIVHYRTIVQGRKFTERRREKVSPLYYYGGRVYTVHQIEQSKIRRKRALLSHMHACGWKKIIKTRFGHFQPFLPGNKLLKTA